LDNPLKEKTSLSSQASNVIEFVMQKRDLVEQSERLKNILEKDILELLASLEEIAGLIG
jgi:hypothetical protein